jgi:hypothetical protein
MRAARVAVLAWGLLIAACGDDSDVSPSTTTTTTAPQSEARPASTSDDVVLACLGSEGTPEDVQALWDLVSVPSETGVGTDLATGVASVSLRGSGIAVEFEPGAGEVDRQRVLQLLEEPPVEAVLSGASVDICG